MAHTLDTSARIPTTNNTTSTANPVTASYTCGAGTTVLVVAVVHAGSTARSGGAPTFNGVALTQADQQRYGSATPECSAELWYMIAPPTGSAYTLNVPNSGGLATKVWIASFKAQSGYGSALDVAGGLGATGAAQSPAHSVTTTVNGDAVMAVVANGAQSWAPSSQSGTALWNEDLGSWGGGAQYLLQGTAGSTTMSWTFTTAEDWGVVIAAFKEVAGGTTYNDSASAARASAVAAADGITGFNTVTLTQVCAAAAGNYIIVEETLYGN